MRSKTVLRAGNTHQPVVEEESVRIEHDRSIELNEQLRGFIVSRPLERVIHRTAGSYSLPQEGQLKVFDDMQQGKTPGRADECGED